MGMDVQTEDERGWDAADEYRWSLDEFDDQRDYVEEAYNKWLMNGGDA
jgi:hypothetical protein